MPNPRLKKGANVKKPLIKDTQQDMVHLLVYALLDGITHKVAEGRRSARARGGAATFFLCANLANAPITVTFADGVFLSSPAV